MMIRATFSTGLKSALAFIIASSSMVPAVAGAIATKAPTAQQQAATNPGGGMEIAPVLIELKANPGQTITSSLRIRNVTTTPFVVTPHMDDFIAKGENGEPQILPDGQKSADSMSGWISSEGDVLLNPNVYTTVKFTINVPKTADPGGHYGVIRFAADQSRPDNSKSGVAISASVGSLLLVTVNGKFTESLKYLQFKAGSGSNPTSFFEHGPITFTQRIENDGNVHEKPVGQVVILTSSGRKVAGIPINPKDGNVLPHSVRSFSESWSTKAIFGHYTATAHLAYANGKTLESPIVSFWIIPFHLIGYGLLGLLVLIVIARIIGSRYSFTVAKAPKSRR